MKNTREAQKAGSWYPARPSELNSLIKTFLEYSSSEIDLNEISKRHCLAAIVPHAGLAFSGECATRAYYALSQKHPSAKTLIIFGAVHSYCPSSAGVWTNGEWETPLGNLEIDSELAEKVVALDYATEDFSSHIPDNAIELQTPLIKYFFPDIKILPISTPPSQNSIRLGKDIAIITENSKNDYIVIGSSDLTHYGSAYDFSPAGTGINGVEWARNNDKKLIKLIENIEAENIIPEAASNHSACGSGAIAATLGFAQYRGIRSGLTLEHVLSYDIMPSDPPELSVGYASIVF